MTRITGKETDPTGPSGSRKEAIRAPAALQAPFASLPEASDAADAWFATAPEWVAGVHVEVQLTASTVAIYSLRRNGSVCRIA